jgi:predicted helicase
MSFIVAALADLLRELDPDDNVRGKQFERVCKWYLEHDPVYAGQLTRVWLWRDWPSPPPRGNGGAAFFVL